MASSTQEGGKVAARTRALDSWPGLRADVLSVRVRLALMGAALVAVAINTVAVTATSLWPGGTLEVSGIFGTALLGGALAPLLAVILVFAALVASNPRLGVRARKAWYVSLLLATPVALPSYWLLHVFLAPLRAQGE